jgi:hypothetical protein
MGRIHHLHVDSIFHRSLISEHRLENQSLHEPVVTGFASELAA